ncbi:hypothetical protein LTR84_010072 [Exophiala bonariae]|uniref:Amidase domain-containing protein n=1 Tax=Exophiala bonariae TaxID=1690606 RepID=A0AAV9NNW7_9EURO|nr:hypothetical protein LTR84_010072 [Exophiala bonariae]
MVAQLYPLVQSKPIPQGTPEYEEKRTALLRAFYEKIPREYYVSQSIIDNPPADVTGIPASSGILTAEEIEITENYDTISLAEAIAARKYTAVTVAKAFSKRAIIAHQLTCCLTQWYPEMAEKRAQELDDYLEKNGKTIGPLHGVPVSIKEHMPIAGTYSSMGFFSSIVYNEHDSQMVRILRNLGAVFYCKTNQPQTIMHLESDSHWGRVLNPYNIHLSAGGSTGGEAALIAMKGSVIGVGTDIGGSIRGPSAFCGIYGFKPTSYTLPMKDFLAGTFPAELNVLCASGPMCRTLRDMDLFTRLILSAKPYLEDPRIVPIPWTGLETAAAQRPLKIGIIEHDGFIDPQPPVKRAIAWARQKLSAAEHGGKFQVKSFTPYGAHEAWTQIRRIYWPDAGKGEIDPITAAGEPMHPLSSWIWKDAEPHGMLTATQVSAQRGERDAFRFAFAKAWEEQDVDVVIGPAFVGPASAHDTAFYWTYTSLYNFVDYPGVVFPTPVKAEKADVYPDDYTPLSDECNHVRELYAQADFTNAPIDLQINARKYHDNDLFAALATLKDVLELP